MRARLKSDAVDIGTLESEVYDHLYSFFRRYYTEGDFLAKRVYKSGVYAIPYEGEEVMLHWANKDQYYVKTSEYLRDYAFRLRPEDENNQMRVHFRLGGCCGGRSTATLRPRRGQGPRIHSWRRRANVAATSSPRRTVGKARNSSSTSSTALRLLTDWPEDERDGKTKPPVQKDIDRVRRPEGLGRGRRRIDAVDGRAGQAACDGERGEGRLQPAGGAS